MCETACPVDINTGDLVRRLRAQEAGAAPNALWGAAAGRWDLATGAASTAISAAGQLPAVLPRAATDVGRALLGAETVPQYRPELPRRGGSGRRGGGRGRASADVAAVYLPGCVHTMFGAAGSSPGVPAALDLLAQRAGMRLAVPDEAASLCCGTPFSSKGMRAAKETMRQRVRRALLAASGDGALPVVVDAASCTEGVVGALEGTGIEVVDAVTWVRRHLLGHLPVRQRAGSVTVHPTCSTTRLGAGEDLVAIAAACAAEVVVPVAWGCCAYAGDRGMLHPELTASATAAEAAEVAAHRTDWYVSANRTCELGMQAATGQEYRHVLELLEAVTR
ncbi:heterodisulfide reductase-related iron-sulfur binding cluster [Brachybacterium sp. UNK5269]|uniref:heterodisulfide reductase-related iron-sulfur binding cluster n=1 Tax=Brachybacterium sp. UNK5269 TaxID=3408576 RepID=UPI003BAF1F02